MSDQTNLESFIAHIVTQEPAGRIVIVAADSHDKREVELIVHKMSIKWRRSITVVDTPSSIQIAGVFAVRLTPCARNVAHSWVATLDREANYITKMERS